MAFLCLQGCMNLRLQKYKKNRMAGMGIVNAARAAGYSESYSTKKSYRIEHRAKVGLADAFERAGLTDRKIIEHALQGLEATREIIIDGEKYGDSPEWSIRHKYLETILKITERLKEKPDAGGTTVNVFPSKTFIFRDLDDDANRRNLYEPQSAEGSRIEIAVQSP